MEIRKIFKIMVLEDNELIRNEIYNLLNKSGYEAIKIMDFKEVAKEVKDHSPDLILLDVNLPKDDGFKICTKIRTFSKVPIIIVTNRNTNIDELMGIRLGADDFITKPYNTQILLARIDSILKRAYPTENKAECLQHNKIILNMVKSIIEYNNKSVDLNKNELKILYYLLKNNRKIVSRVDILEYLWDNTLFVNDNTLTVNITRIRAKIEELGIKDYIKTKRGQGYMV